MAKCSMNTNCFHSHYWKLSFSKALSTDSQTFQTVSLCFAMCFRDNEDKTWTLGGGYLKYFISAALGEILTWQNRGRGPGPAAELSGHVRPPGRGHVQGREGPLVIRACLPLSPEGVRTSVTYPLSTKICQRPLSGKRTQSSRKDTA